MPEYNHLEEAKTNPIILEIINEWVSNGLLAFGNKNDLDAQSFGYISVTSYGEECFQNEIILPYDPDGYLAEYKAQVASVDDITLKYLGEAITAYNRDLLLSSAITLGVASENVVLLLIESFAQALPNTTRRSSFQNRIRDKWITSQYTIFKAELSHFLNQIPTDLKQDLDTYLDGIFNFIRVNRNQAGHPTGNMPVRKVALHNIQMFVDYSKRVFDIREFFLNNSFT
ncbi:hypothetical protein A2893_00630 [Candidatus Woesebacteria bacterium RIFCSPLOWO2_01_FULL_39_25]|uniref:Uncharacterized protein n=1 Tax=Candidatus Woesebacteria bacterium RIFCSPLOWO2_01_FULL_39_25 TaxID=1802521 RepID=A0A1F8BMG1_9BACT|nr:MAG: hypothetical protein A2893_00630 [Candidatus Woesebacteria bacterium RIFCSPLOWO2_01_FULL_39_25]